jgi:hypothetical protein
VRSPAARRWPDLTPGGLLRLGDYIGSAACAWAGALIGGERGMDLLGCLIMAQVTTVGGGTIRDLFLNHEQGTGRARARRPQPPMLAARSAAPAARPGFLTARAAAGQGKRAFWISEPEYLAIGQVFGALTFFFWNPIAERLRLSQDDAVFFWWDKTPPPSPPVLTGHVSSLLPY